MSELENPFLKKTENQYQNASRGNKTPLGRDAGFIVTKCNYLKNKT